ncbi:serine/threonine-protein kinase RsbT [Paenibacillus sp. oral taxon 786 str. D14]|uniref:ATP-binding protein n=1 Tax=Paenibacillus sp. oral taxon 786 TaxID=652715 RepID=UPI0001AFD9D1|nr:ATP-binding protein [Paenibacillus sp. oral taxon 786]EES73124.1 serine/threonine-protein kinase RsbT [Paenibacillus sp. oral taxon 786 str. D14]
MTYQKVNISSEDDIYFALSTVRHFMKQLPFSEADQQRIYVSVSELTRNILDHACGKGIFYCELIDQGIRFTVTDEGPGIPNINEVLNGKKGSSSCGLGLGLSGVKRLMDEFQIETSTRGTKIVATKRTGKN